MPPLWQLRVFLSCPEDMGTEANLVADVISRLNPRLEDSCGVSLRLLTWKTAVVPGIGPDPQAVINEQIGKYDIYIGLLGSRFGTETPRAGSGTEEEFGTAYDRFKESPQSLRVLFYFKDDIGSLQKVDPEQLRKVQQFRRRISEAGVFYHVYKTDEFSQTLENHIWTLIEKQWESNRWRGGSDGGDHGRGADKLIADADTDTTKSDSALATILGRSEFLAENLADETDDRPGLLDVMVEAEDNLTESTASLARITEITRRLEKQLEARTAGVKSSTQSAKELKHFVDGAAADMKAYAKDLQAEIAVYSTRINSGFDLTEAAIDFWLREGSVDRDQVTELVKNLEAYVSTLQESVAAMSTFRNIIDAAPPVAKSMRQAKRAVTYQVDQLIAVALVSADKAIKLQGKARVGKK